MLQIRFRWIKNKTGGLYGHRFRSTVMALQTPLIEVYPQDGKSIVIVEDDGG